MEGVIRRLSGAWLIQSCLALVYFSRTLVDGSALLSAVHISRPFMTEWATGTVCWLPATETVLPDLLPGCQFWASGAVTLLETLLGVTPQQDRHYSLYISSAH